jgi:hypothetical protein
MNEVEYAKQYPFERAGHSYLFVDGNIIPISNFNSISWEKCTLSETGNPEISIAILGTEFGGKIRLEHPSKPPADGSFKLKSIRIKTYQCSENMLND